MNALILEEGYKGRSIAVLSSSPLHHFCPVNHSLTVLYHFITSKTIDMYSCSMLGSASEKYYRPIVSKAANGLDPTNHQPEDGFRGWHQDEVVQSLGKKYLAMKARYRALGLILPLLLADATSMLYSTKDWEREFMIKLWELLEIYSNERPIDRSDHDYPNRFFKEDGPIPILVASRMKLPFAPFIARPRGRDNAPFRWSDDQYRYALLAMRSVSDSFLERLMLMVSWESPLNIMSMATRSLNMRAAPTTVVPNHARISSLPSLRYPISLGPEMLGTRIRLNVVIATYMQW